jgi:hypothetical protein
VYRDVIIEDFDSWEAGNEGSKKVDFFLYVGEEPEGDQIL